MKTVIMYASVHHNNTKELVCAIAAENDIDVVDATKITEKDLSGYDLIGFASGIYFGKMHQSVINFAEVNLPENKDVFLMCTYGGKPVFDSIKKIVKEKQGRIVGEFSCKGFDTFGPFKLIGGISKGHPDKKLMDPKYIEVWGKFTPRGGISIDPYCNYGKPGTKWEEIAFNRMANHDMYPEKVDNR